MIDDDIKILKHLFIALILYFLLFILDKLLFNL